MVQSAINTRDNEGVKDNKFGWKQITDEDYEELREFFGITTNIPRESLWVMKDSEKSRINYLNPQL